MNSLAEAKIQDFLIHWLHYRPYDCGTALECMRSLARMAGYDALDENFAQAGLGAGPDAHIASSITDRALGGGGTETTDYAMRMEINDWLRRFTRKGRL